MTKSLLALAPLLSFLLSTHAIPLIKSPALLQRVRDETQGEKKETETESKALEKGTEKVETVEQGTEQVESGAKLDASLIASDDVFSYVGFKDEHKHGMVFMKVSKTAVPVDHPLPQRDGLDWYHIPGNSPLHSEHGEWAATKAGLCFEDLSQKSSVSCVPHHGLDAGDGVILGFSCMADVAGLAKSKEGEDASLLEGAKSADKSGYPLQTFMTPGAYGNSYVGAMSQMAGMRPMVPAVGADNYVEYWNDCRGGSPYGWNSAWGTWPYNYYAVSNNGYYGCNTLVGGVCQRPMCYNCMPINPDDIMPYTQYYTGPDQYFNPLYQYSAYSSGGHGVGYSSANMMAPGQLHSSATHSTTTTTHQQG